MPRSKARGKTHVELEGVDDLKKALLRLDREALANVKEAIDVSTDEVLQGARARIAVRTGESKSKITRRLLNGGLLGSVGGTWFKLRFLELGTKKMAARPFLFPAWESVRPKFLQRLTDALNKAGRDASVA